MAQIDPGLRSRIIVPSDDISSLSKSQMTNNEAPLTRRTQNNIFRTMVDDACSLNLTPGDLSDNSPSQY
jgi:hypothetical protein